MGETLPRGPNGSPQNEFPIEMSSAPCVKAFGGTGVASTLSRLVRHILCSPAHTAAAAASKKRISPQPAELCHTAAARKLTPKTEKKEKNKEK